MSKAKMGIGTIDINKKFTSYEEASRYAKRLRQYINYICKKYKYQASVITVVSNIKKGVSALKYVHNGKKGRPKKELTIYDTVANNWYRGDYNTDWHIHLLIVSIPSYALRNHIKKYIDKNWKDISKIHDTFDYNKKKVYKKTCNIKMADYFINQSSEIRFVNCNYSADENFEYTLKDYYREYMKMNSNKTKLYIKHKYKPLDDMEFLDCLDKIEYRFKVIENYFLELSKKDELIEQKDFMKQVQLQKISDNYDRLKCINKVQIKI